MNDIADAHRGNLESGLHLLVFGYIFYFLIVLIIVLCDLVYALPEFCSVVAHEICGLECFGVFM